MMGKKKIHGHYCHAQWTKGLSFTLLLNLSYCIEKMSFTFHTLFTSVQCQVLSKQYATETTVNFN